MKKILFFTFIFISAVLSAQTGTGWGNIYYKMNLKDSVNMAKSFRIGNVWITPSATQFNYLDIASGRTGTGSLVFSNSPVFTTPNIGTATGSITGNAATVTTNANLTGVVTSVGNATSFAANPTFTGTVTIPTPFTLGATSVTANGTELNVLDNIPGTLTSTELGYVDGVTSAIQTQLNALTTGNDTALHYDATFGIYRNTGTNDREYYVYDIDVNGKLEELAAAVVDARSYTSPLINVASGDFLIDTCIIFTSDNSTTSVRGNNTRLVFRSGYTGEAIYITSTSNLYRLKISDLTFREAATRYQDWDGINVVVASDDYIQFCVFDGLSFTDCDNVIKVNLTSTAWMNGNTFNNIQAESFVQFLEVTQAAGTFFDYNCFYNIQLQAVNGITTVGVDTLNGQGNSFYNFMFWDAPAGAYGFKFGSGSFDNIVIGGSIGEIGYLDYSASKSNYVQSAYVRAGNSAVRQNYSTPENEILASKSTGNIVAGTGITAAMLGRYMLYNGDSNIDISANPNIVAGLPGQVITIMGVTANTLTLTNGEGIYLTTSTVVIGAACSITLIYNADYGVWVEIARAII